MPPAFALVHMSALGAAIASGGYRGVILDQFGVLHDGAAPYPAAAHALSELARRGIPAVVLSNSSRRASAARAKLGRLFPDVPPPLVVTSGELARARLARAAPARVLHLNWAARSAVTPHDAGLDPAELVSLRDAQDDPACVRLVVAHGTEGVAGPDGVVPLGWEELVGLVRRVAAAGNARFVCVNPDFVTVDRGVLRTMPGQLARVWEEAGGGRAERLGKPEGAAYDAALEALDGVGVGKDEVLAVGDSVAHDVLGAHDAGIDCMYVAGGIHAENFGLRADAAHPDVPGWTFDWGVWYGVVRDEAPGCARPAYVVDYLRW